MARPLRDVFSELTGDGSRTGTDPAELLRASGHADLPDELVSEAVASYADTAPPAVAEHLAPFVTEYRGIVVAEDAAGAPGSWVDLLATAPEPTDEPAVDPGALLDETFGGGDAAHGTDAVEHHVDGGLDGDFDDDLDDHFGSGQDPADGLDSAASVHIGPSTVHFGPAESGDAGEHHIGEDQLFPPHESTVGVAEVVDHRHEDGDTDADDDGEPDLDDI